MLAFSTGDVTSLASLAVVLVVAVVGAVAFFWKNSAHQDEVLVGTKTRVDRNEKDIQVLFDKTEGIGVAIGEIKEKLSGTDVKLDTVLAKIDSLNGE